MHFVDGDWAIVELLGRRRLGGFVSQVKMFGTTMLRLELPTDDDESDEIHSTQYYAAGALYCVTPCTESAAREAARDALPPAPVAPSDDGDLEDIQW